MLSNIITKFQKTIVATWVVTIVFFMSCSTHNSSSPKGLAIEFMVQNHDTIHPVLHDIVTVSLAYGLDDTLMFDSYLLDVPMEFPILPSAFIGDLYTGLTQMSKGDSAHISVIADSFYLKSAQVKSLPSFVKSGEILTYRVKLLDFVNRAEYEIRKQARIQQKQDEEQRHLKQYLAVIQDDYQLFPSGLVLFDQGGGIGKLPDTGDMCQVYFTVSIFEGDTLFSNFEEDPFDIEFGKDFDNVGFMEGLGQLREGQKARLIVPSVVGVGPQGYDGVEGFTTLDYTLHFVQIRPLEVVNKERKLRKEQKNALNAKNKHDEPRKIKEYLKQSNLSGDSLPSGMYIFWKTKGEGLHPDKEGSEVTIHYIQYSLDGSILNSSYDDEPFIFLTGRKSVIQGWEEAVQLMAEGDKVHVVIPSKMGYGSKGRGKRNPPFTPLVFDLELLEVKN